MANDRPTAADFLISIGELAHEVRQLGATLASMRAESADGNAWARRDRLEAQATIAARDATIAARDATIAELRASHSEEAANALRARIAELERERDAPPPTVARLASRAGAFVETLTAGMTGPRLAGMVGVLAALVIACGMGWQVWHFPTDTAASIVMRLLDIVDHMTGAPAPATPSGMVLP